MWGLGGLCVCRGGTVSCRGAGDWYREGPDAYCMLRPHCRSSCRGNFGGGSGGRGPSAHRFPLGLSLRDSEHVVRSVHVLMVLAWTIR